MMVFCYACYCEFVYALELQDKGFFQVDEPFYKGHFFINMVKIVNKGLCEVR